MNEAPTSGWSLPDAEARHVEKVSTRFEAAWKAGDRPVLEDYLADTPEPARSVLVQELLVLELTYRVRAGERPTLDEYRLRFPALAERLPTLFRKVPGLPTGETTLFIPPTLSQPLNPDDRPSLPQGPYPVNLPLQVVPGYEVLEEIGRGGMGVVYRARQTGLNRLVALKMILAGPIAGPQQLARFRKEAEAVARLQHPNIVQVYDSGEQQGLPYFSMELAEGGSLKDQLRSGPLSPREAARLVSTLARAIHHAHQREIIHRDLKSANVLLQKQEGGRRKEEQEDLLLLSSFVPKIADFGLARSMTPAQGHSSVSGLVAGTPSYMAPEQAQGRTREVGPRTDVYALGAILYECLTGRPPFQGDTPLDTLEQVVQRDPIPPTRLRSDVPAELEMACLKCLEKESDQRYPSADALAQDLDRYLDGEPLSIQALPEWERHARWARRVGYEILDILGADMLGITYKARQKCLDRLVVLKMLAAEAQPDSAQRAHFRTAVQVLARLHHPNIVQLYDFGEQHGVFYYSMEFLDGGRLSTHPDYQLLPPRKAAALVEALARAVHYAHKQGIPHCGFKPDNVRFSGEGVPKITRFRPARRPPAEYLAPEEAGGRLNLVGPATDVYGLGVILYKLITGRPPFGGETLEETREQVCSQNPEPPTRLRPEVPVDLESVCLKCLQKDPGQRYPSALELAEDLRRFLEGEPVSTGPADEGYWHARCAERAGYEILDILGADVLGITYKARQKSLDRVVALKMLVGGAQTDPARKARFHAAAQSLARLHHPNIIQVYDAGEQGGRPYLAMELISGDNLANRLGGKDRPGTLLSPTESAALVEVLARATHYAHQRGVVHGGLKPFLVWLTQEDVPKITGFGLARLVEAEDPDAARRDAQFALSRYMAPEQVDDKPVGPATDIYGLGTILYELLAGQPPVMAETVREMLEQVRSHQPPPPSALRPGVLPNLEAICLKCLEKDPGKRYASALDLATDLLGFMGFLSDREE